MYNSSQGCHTSTRTHMPHGITQCNLPPDLGDSKVVLDLATLEGCRGIPARRRSHVQVGQSTNRTRRGLTSFVRRTPLTTAPRRPGDKCPTLSGNAADCAVAEKTDRDSRPALTGNHPPASRPTALPPACLIRIKQR